MYFLLLIIYCIFPTSQVRVCRPKISESYPDKDGYCQIECDFSTCDKVSKIIYEKTGIYEQSLWTPVFEGINKTNYHPLYKTTNNYTLENRIDFTVFYTKQVLYIYPLIPKDGGEWRCVVYDAFSQSRTSLGVEVNIYDIAPPEDVDLNISQRNRELVVGQTTEFTCAADNLYPQPDVVWKVYDREYTTGLTINKQHYDGSWFVKNTIRLGFHEAGNNELSCVLKTHNRNPWLLTNIIIDVKDPSAVLSPKKEKHVTSSEVLSFTLNCSGSGYKPDITWTRNGVHIFANDTGFIMEKMCNDSLCVGSLTSKPVDTSSVCTYKDDYEGVYSCIIFLQTPYQSVHVSPHMTVSAPQNLCENKSHVGTILGFIIPSLIALAVIVAIVVLLKNKKQLYSRVNYTRRILITE